MTSNWISVMQKSAAKLSDGIPGQRFTGQLLQFCLVNDTMLPWHPHRAVTCDFALLKQDSKLH